jgi:hypothetical protein
MSRSLLRVADQHHVGFTVAADEGELFAVVGVVEVADEFRFEVSSLNGWAGDEPTIGLPDCGDAGAARKAELFIDKKAPPERQGIDLGV